MTPDLPSSSPVSDAPAPSDAPASEADSRLSIVQEITLALNATMDPGKLLDLLIDSCIRYTGATTGSVMLVSPKNDLELVGERGLNVGKEFRLQVGQGITGWVAEHGVSLNVPDVKLDDRYVKIKDHIRSELAVPMLRQGRVLGVISVDSTRRDNFSSDDIQILSFVGAQAAQILENAQSYDAMQRRSVRDEVLLEMSQALGSALDLEELFREVMATLKHAGAIQRGCLVLTDGRDSDELSIVYAHGMTPEEMAKGRYQRGEGIIGRAFKTKKPIGVRDIRKEPKFLGRTGAFRRDEQVSFYAIPVILEGKAVGVFGAVKEFTDAQAFDEDMALLQILASTLSQAVKIHQAASQQKAVLVQENKMLREELRTQYRFDNIVGNSEAMQKVFRTVMSVAPTKSTVLIRGESGTGKELIAHAIHYNSQRADFPFVRVNCAAIPEHLLEAELFGHVKGAFTGAIADRRGKFSMADGGTIFLDEIGDMTPMLQAKILRVLQEREIDAVGAELPQQVDVRIIAATHQPLEKLVEDGDFREDLYYRLNVVPITVPPLRERTEDIRILATHFLEKLREETELVPGKISPDALRVLMQHGWPGNVRELENIIERASIMCESENIGASDLPALGGPVRSRANSGGSGCGASLEEAVARRLQAGLGDNSNGSIWDDTMETVESALIQGALNSCGGVRLRAAKVLGIHRNTLRKKIEELGI